MATVAEEEALMYGGPAATSTAAFPHRPHNHSRTPTFTSLVATLFSPLAALQTQPRARTRTRNRPNAFTLTTAFYTHYRAHTGPDIYPVLRLALPALDRDRPLYRIKHTVLAKLLVRVLRLDARSADAARLLRWRHPGRTGGTGTGHGNGNGNGNGNGDAANDAGDFASRVVEAVRRRPAPRAARAALSVAELNQLLDALAGAGSGAAQTAVLAELYGRTSAAELGWVVRIVLREMKMGVSEGTLLRAWHADAMALWGVCLSLRRVCWELWDAGTRLGEGGIRVGQCFRPMLAAFPGKRLELVVARMGDEGFWMEEKLDGERMQVHVVTDDTGRRRFAYYSRQGQDYTELYGARVDGPGALTRHLRGAFADGVRNVILDGEMITWDPQQQAVGAFGTLKTAALAERRWGEEGHGGEGEHQRPVLRVFDCVWLNDADLTRYTLRDRRAALDGAVRGVARRLEVHARVEARTKEEVEAALREVMATGGEGLVLKNPGTGYRVQHRGEEWVKVKPEYMSELGEALDCVVVAGWYGSGARGGALSSFLCGLRVDGDAGGRCVGFFKVGGGFAAEDYRRIRHVTDGKWRAWGRRGSPWLVGGSGGVEMPDQWIAPADSVVIAVKAAAVVASADGATGWTLRFPRFRKFCGEKTWREALSVGEFGELRARVERERRARKEEGMEVEGARRRNPKRRRREVVVLGGEVAAAGDDAGDDQGTSTGVFDEMKFHVMTEMSGRGRGMTQGQVEQLIRRHGGRVVASLRDPTTVAIADRRLVKVAGLCKQDERDVLRPGWVVECVRQGEVDVGRGRRAIILPPEPRHVFFQATASGEDYKGNADEFGDSFAVDVDGERLRTVMGGMGGGEGEGEVWGDYGGGEGDIRRKLMADMGRGGMWEGVRMMLVGDEVKREWRRRVEFGGGKVVDEKDEATHVVAREWLEECWRLARMPSDV